MARRRLQECAMAAAMLLSVDAARLVEEDFGLQPADGEDASLLESPYDEATPPDAESDATEIQETGARSSHTQLLDEQQTREENAIRQAEDEMHAALRKVVAVSKKREGSG